jgi:hypothetical protein
LPSCEIITSSLRRDGSGRFAILEFPLILCGQGRGLQVNRDLFQLAGELEGQGNQDVVCVKKIGRLDGEGLCFHGRIQALPNWT